MFHSTTGTNMLLSFSLLHLPSDWMILLLSLPPFILLPSGLCWYRAWPVSCFKADLLKHRSALTNLQLLLYDAWSTPPGCSGRFLPTGKYPFSHLLPQVVLSLHPTHIVHLLVLAEHSPAANALTDRPNPANDPFKLEMMQYSVILSAFSL